MKKILFTGGGSAGHVLPNLALMEELLSLNKADVCYMGSDGIEKTLLAKQKIPYYQIACPKLIRSGGFSAFKQNTAIPFQLLKAVREAEKGLRIFQPDLVFSKGGYVALPVVLAADRLGIPCMSHESDFSPGLTTKLTARKCARVFTSFPETAKRFKNGKYSGPLIRRSVFSATKAEARKYFHIKEKEKVLLVFGGGSGSQYLNEVVRSQLKTLCETYTILHLCGKGNEIKCNLKNYLQFEFIEDMGMAYACADIVLSRAGAGTVFEILAMKKPSLLVPLEKQSRGDQKENAAYFFNKGLCHVAFEGDLDDLSTLLNATLSDKELKENLLTSAFSKGNESVLRELTAFIDDVKRT